MNLNKIESVFLVKDAGQKQYNGLYVKGEGTKYVHVDNHMVSIERTAHVWYLGIKDQGVWHEGHYKAHGMASWDHPPQHGWTCMKNCCEPPVVVPAKPLLEKQIYAWVQQNPNGRIEDLAKNIQIDYRAFGFNSIHTFVQSIKRVNLQNNNISIAAPIKPKNIQPGVVIVNGIPMMPVTHNTATVSLGALQNVQLRKILNEHQILMNKYQYSKQRHMFYKASFIKCNDELIKSQDKEKELQNRIEVLRKENSALKYTQPLKEELTQTQVRLQQRVIQMSEETKTLKEEIEKYSQYKEINERLEMTNIALMTEIGLLKGEKERIEHEGERIEHERNVQYKEINERLEMKNLALMTEIGLLKAEKERMEYERQRLEHERNEMKNQYQQQLRVQNDKLRENKMTLRVEAEHLRTQNFTLCPMEGEPHVFQGKSSSMVGNFHTTRLGRGRRGRTCGRRTRLTAI